MGDRRTFLLTDLALLVLLGATYGISYLHLGVFNLVLNLGIAVAKAGLVVWFFMQLRAATGLVRLFAGAGLLWLVVLFCLGLNDWLTR